jgi:hypothetical protein
MQHVTIDHFVNDYASEDGHAIVRCTCWWTCFYTLQMTGLENRLSFDLKLR